MQALHTVLRTLLIQAISYTRHDMPLHQFVDLLEQVFAVSLKTFRCILPGQQGITCYADCLVSYEQCVLSG